MAARAESSEPETKAAEAEVREGAELEVEVTAAAWLARVRWAVVELAVVALAAGA